MKSVIALVGSARRNGVTYRATRLLLDRLEAQGDVRTELAFLSERNLGLCRGCKACFLRGEEHCPLHDDRDALFESMMRADGVVLASPVYSFQVSGVMKVFLDRLGFACHRPRFHGRVFTSIAVEGIWGGGAVVKYLDLVGGAVGFDVVQGCTVTARKNPNTAHQAMDEAERRRMEEGIADLARRFHAQLLRPPFPEPSLLQFWVFRMARTSFRLELGEEFRDHVHYRERGWFDSAYYYPTRLGPLKRAAGAAFDWMAARASRRLIPR
jgi:multimeric flavodoxin WrbA